jgi:ATP-dependent protease HslVU (ClpYQ) peptidase subunit
LFDTVWTPPRDYDYVGAGGATNYAVAAARALSALRPHVISLEVFRQVEEMVQQALPANAGKDESPDDPLLKVFCIICVNLER